MKRARNAGTVAVEFAIIGLFFVALLMFALDIGWQMVIEAALGAGGRAASRFGTTGTLVAAGVTPPPTTRDGSILQLVIQNSGGLLLASKLIIEDRSYASFADAAINKASTPGPGSAGQVVVYKFTYSQAYLTPVVALAATIAKVTGLTAPVFSDPLVHTLLVTVLNEPFPTP